MEWLNRMNDVLDYLETCMTGKADYVQAARIACCSLPRLQNMFLFITDVTLAEYVRRRRMAVSAQELLKSDCRVIDIALKYGYDSPEAFTRSFKAFHGISPSDVRRYGKAIDYPRISFQIMITGGHFTMDSTAQMTVYKDLLVKMDTLDLPASFKLAGVTSEGLPHFQNIYVFHDRFKPIMETRRTPYTEVGISSNIANPKGTYIFGCEVDSIDDLPQGLVGVDTGIRRFAVLTFRVKPGEDLVGGSDGPGEGMNMASDYLKNEWIPKNIDRVYGYHAEQNYFEIKKADMDYRITNAPTTGVEERYCLAYWIEVYRVDIQQDPEMCFYIPLKG